MKGVGATDANLSVIDRAASPSPRGLLRPRLTPESAVRDNRPRTGGRGPPGG